jgi:hypothetical protein
MIAGGIIYAQCISTGIVAGTKHITTAEQRHVNLTAASVISVRISHCYEVL